MQTRPPIGQHWLIDQDALQAMVEAACLDQDDLVCEIGPGGGQLTSQILQTNPKRLIGLELDRGLVVGLKAKYTDQISSGQFSLINQDCLLFDYNQLRDYKICSNLPYYLTAKLLRILTDCKNQPLQNVSDAPQVGCSETG